MIRNFKTILILFFFSIANICYAQNSNENNSQTRLLTPPIKAPQDIVSSDLEDIKNDNLNIVESFFKKNKLNSLMFDDEEIDQIKRALTSFESGEALEIDNNGSQILSEQDKIKIEQQKRERELVENNEKSQINLSSIIFLSDENWSIWLNKNKITSDNNSKNNEFYVLNIESTKAKILWNLSLSKWKILSGKNENEVPNKINDKNQIQIIFTLKTNQTYILKSGAVIEGKQKSFQSKNKILPLNQKQDIIP